MGYPIIESIYPKTGIIYTSMYVAIFNLFLWSYGISLFTGQRDWKSLKNALFNPGIISTVLGLILYVCSIKIPFTLLKAFSMVGSMTTPLSLLIIGSLLSQVNFKEMFAGRDLYISIVMRLLILPLLIFFALYTQGIKGEVANILVLVTAMPVAAITVIFAENFDADSILASKLTALSTMLSMLTLPGLIIFVSLFG
jgi:predicted permease